MTDRSENGPCKLDFPRCVACHLFLIQIEPFRAVPTKDEDVRAKLRTLGEPITLFGERAGDRRDRLRELISLIKENERAKGIEIGSDEGSESGSDSSESDKEEEYYTEGGQTLLQHRQLLAHLALQNSRQRINRQKQEASIPLGRLLEQRKRIYNELKTFTTLGSQLADDRPVSIVRFSPNSQFLATGSWAGHAKIWDMPSCSPLATLKGHNNERLGGLAWHPQATLSQSPSALNLATGAADNNVCLWPLQPALHATPSSSSHQPPEPVTSPLKTLQGHTGRVSRVAFHPSGSSLASASFDKTWRLWDAESGSCLLEQEGHSHPVYALAFQQDGALLCSGGLDAIGRVWDLRTGKTAMVLDGHVKDILGIDFAPNGHQVATGSNDDTVRIWDMRSLKSIYTLAAHGSTISDLTFFRSHDNSFPYTIAQKSQQQTNGDADTSTDRPDGQKPVDMTIDGIYLATSGYDGLVKFWSADDWQLIKALGNPNGGKIMSVDLARSASLFNFFWIDRGLTCTIKMASTWRQASLVERINCGLPRMLLYRYDVISIRSHAFVFSPPVLPSMLYTSRALSLRRSFAPPTTLQ